MDAILKSLKDLTENDPYYLGVETILLSYDPSKSSTENIKNLESNYTKDQLTAAVYFSKSLETDYPAIVQRINQRKSRNKPQLAGDIAILISGVTPIRCEECKQEYIHPAAENTEDNQVSCLLCNRSSHKPCYVNLNDIKPGYHFICTICSTNYKDKSHNTESDTVNEATRSAESDRNEDDAKSDTSSIINSYQSPNCKKSREDVEKDEKWCRMYLQGVCPHGISGRGCSYTHPKRCNKYSRHGDDKWRGCRRGKKCKYFHPRICQNSAELRMCLTKTCKDVHLVGTKRFRPRERNESPNYQEQYQSTSQRSYRYQENHISPWQESQPGTHNTPDQMSDAQKTQNFLVQYLENMKADLTKTMEQKIESVLMQERKPQPLPAKTTLSQQESPCPSNHQKSPQPQPPNPSNLQKSPQPQDIPMNLFPQQNSYQPPPNLPPPLPQVQLQNLLHPQFPLSQNPLPHIYM